MKYFIIFSLMAIIYAVKVVYEFVKHNKRDIENEGFFRTANYYGGVFTPMVIGLLGVFFLFASIADSLSDSNTSNSSTETIYSDKDFEYTRTKECRECDKTYTHNGYSFMMGQVFMQSDNVGKLGIGYCSQSCAYKSMERN